MWQKKSAILFVAILFSFYQICRKYNKLKNKHLLIVLLKKQYAKKKQQKADIFLFVYFYIFV
jgi:TRAP-type mannitol/chloroaromatic compound transport system permease small subunit